MSMSRTAKAAALHRMLLCSHHNLGRCNHSTWAERVSQVSLRQLCLVDAWNVVHVQAALRCSGEAPEASPWERRPLRAPRGRQR